MSLDLFCEIPYANGKAKGLVEIRDDEKLIHSDQIDISSALSRARFAKVVGNKINAPEKAEIIEAKLIAKLDEIRKEHEKKEQEKKNTAEVPNDAPAVMDPDSLVLDPQHPYEMARLFVEKFYTHHDGKTLLWCGKVWYRWLTSHFKIEDEAAIRKQAYDWQRSAFRWQRNKGTGEMELVPFKPTPRTVNDLIDGVQSVCFARGPAPCWLAGESGLPDPKSLLVAINGLFDISEGIDFPPMKPTPNLFTMNALDYAVNPNADVPMAWMAFLQTLWGDDTQSIEFLQEWIGLCVTQITRFQKIMMIIGPKRSGKGTICRILARLLGEANVAWPTLNGIGSTFGLSNLIGKQLAIIPDARLSGKADQAVVVERILSISGEDQLDIERKYLPPTTMKLSTRLMITTNEMPRLTDSSGALPSRFLVLVLRNCFYGKEDMDLESRLIMELPGILRWALIGLARLLSRGYFQTPKSGKEAIEELEDLMSPTGAFVRECCDTGPGLSGGCSELFAWWKKWCKVQGRDHHGNLASFGRDLRAAVPGLTMRNLREGDGRTRVYDGIQIKLGLRLTEDDDPPV